MSDNNILISPTRGMDVVVNTPIDKGLEEPGLSTTRIDMSSPFVAINKTKKSSVVSEEEKSELIVSTEACKRLKTEMVNLLLKVYEPSACHAVMYDLDDIAAGVLFELISNFQVKLESLFEQYNKHSAKVAQLDPGSKIPEMLPNTLSADVWQRARQAVKEKISLKYEANASFDFD